jgi:hypothetical protein
MSSKIFLFPAQKRLAVLWLTSGILLFLLLIFQSINGKYGTQSEAAWSWFLPNIMPTLTMIIGVLIIEGRERDHRKSEEPFLFHLAFALSCVYLVVLALTFFAQPLVTMSPLELMRRSNLWLAPIQGLVTTALGAFFVKSQ